VVSDLLFEQEIIISKFHRVENILAGVSEQNKVLYSCPDYLILPDMKWDLKTISSLYLVALVQDRAIRSLRDLNRTHLGLLKGIRREASRIVKERWELGSGSLRMYVHYQPSYCAFPSYFGFNILIDFLFVDHFHVHIVNVNYEGGLFGMTVGHAHLLDDIISLVSNLSLRNCRWALQIVVGT
jgi:m7GpppX diphosphatase